MANELTSKEMTKLYEGFRPDVYLDTEGNHTVGYGFNVDDPAIAKYIDPDVINGKRLMTEQEADPIFDKLYYNATKDAVRFTGFSAYGDMSETQRDVIIDMSYNLGANKLGEFKNMREAIWNKDWDTTAVEMEDSDWYKQVGDRSKEHVAKFTNQSQLGALNGRQ